MPPAGPQGGPLRPGQYYGVQPDRALLPTSAIPPTGGAGWVCCVVVGPRARRDRVFPAPRVARTRMKRQHLLWLVLGPWVAVLGDRSGQRQAGETGCSPGQRSVRSALRVGLRGGH